ncbi:D-serine/D-alanine/glycine transporter [Raoultella terrigena]|uniref:D-serine/D-alanine/glycine transporter n=1 Tax=Raoultella terrigena TaxID=577 RepID=A0A4U9DBP8_RAOTE|nr:D-serine/D-alanine/glycine transporter [Raoultella terrigena]
MIIGFMLFFVMRAMGELLLSNLEYKSFSDFAADLLGPWAGYFTGWTYWFCWVVTGMADVVAITATPVLVPGPLRLGGLAGGYPAAAEPEPCHRENVRGNGVLVCDGQDRRYRGADCRRPGHGDDALQIADRRRSLFSHLWNDGGWFPKGISGFFAGFQIAVFAFVGIELVGTTAAETKIRRNPCRARLTLSRCVSLCSTSSR